MKRQRLQPDTRLDWRDPDMPLLRRQVDGRYGAIEPHKIQEYYAKKIETCYYIEWKDDPTYNLRKK